MAKDGSTKSQATYKAGTYNHSIARQLQLAIKQPAAQVRLLVLAGRQWVAVKIIHVRIILKKDHYRNNVNKLL